MDRRTLRKQRRSRLKVGDRVLLLCVKGATKCECPWSDGMRPPLIQEGGVATIDAIEQWSPYDVIVVYPVYGKLQCCSIGLRKVSDG